MGAQVIVYNNGQRVGVTNSAYNTVVKKELMREWVLNFSVTNLDRVRPYVIDPNAIFEVDGQKYDTKSYHQESGANNETQVTAFHVLTRMNNYTIPAGYSFVGTIHDIIQDILNVSGAKAEFSAGTCESKSGSYSIGNKNPINAYSAIMGLTAMGVEPSFDNFTINAPTRWGAITGKTFKFGHDLCSLKRTFDKTTTPPTYSYEIDIANLQRLPGGSPDDKFEEGDTVGIQDDLIGDAVNGERIVTYAKCKDDPTQDKVTIGQFISDLSDTVSTMQVDISAAQDTADGAKTAAENSLQPGTSYNGVGMDHGLGFFSNSEDGLHREFNNGTDGDVIQQYYNGNWVTVWQAAQDGTTTSYNLEHTLKVEQGGSTGLSLYKGDGNENWTLIQQLSADGMGATKLFNPDIPYYYGVVGVTPDGFVGMELFGDSNCFCKILNSSSQGTRVLNGDESCAVDLPKGGTPAFLKGNEYYGWGGEAVGGSTRFYVNNGMVTKVEDAFNTYSGTLTFPEGTKLVFTNGQLTSVS